MRTLLTPADTSMCFYSRHHVNGGVYMPCFQMAYYHIQSIAMIRNSLATAACRTTVMPYSITVMSYCTLCLRLCFISCRRSRILRRGSLLGFAEEITSHQFCLVAIVGQFANELYSIPYSSCIDTTLILTTPCVVFFGGRSISVEQSTRCC